MAERGGGSVVSIASAAELAGRGVRVNSVYPTSVPTAMAESDARDTGVTTAELLEAAPHATGRAEGPAPPG